MAVSGSRVTQHAGEDYSLNCTVSGGETTATTTYQWRRDNSPLSGKTSATLSFTPLRQTTPSSNGQYVCEAMRSGRTVRSANVTIIVTGKYISVCNMIMLHIDIAPPLTLVITPSGSPNEGQTYSLTCDLMGDESLDVPDHDVDNSFRWDRLTPILQREFHRGATLSFTPLNLNDAGDYMCTNTITSPYLTRTRTHTKEANIILYGECFKILCSAIIHNLLLA